MFTNWRRDKQDSVRYGSQVTYPKTVDVYAHGWMHPQSDVCSR